MVGRVRLGCVCHRAFASGETNTLVATTCPQCHSPHAWRWGERSRGAAGVERPTAGLRCPRSQLHRSVNACQTGPAHPHVAVDEADRQDPVAPDGRPLEASYDGGACPESMSQCAMPALTLPQTGSSRTPIGNAKARTSNCWGDRSGSGPTTPSMNSPMPASSGSRASTSAALAKRTAAQPGPLSTQL